MAPVGGVHVNLVIVDSDASVWVTGGDGDLEVGGEGGGGGGGDVEGVEGEVLEGEVRFCGAEDEVYEEDYEENNEND